MPLRCFEFAPMAKENTKYISDKEFNDIENDFLSQWPGRCSPSVVLTLRRWGKNHIKQLTDIVSIKNPTDIVSNYQQKQQTTNIH